MGDSDRRLVTAVGSQPADNVNNSTKSLHVPAFEGACRDACSQVDDDDMSTDAEMLAKVDIATNTNITKSIKLLKASTLPHVWSLTDRIYQLVATSSVTEVIWRTTSPSSTVLDVEKDIRVIPALWYPW